MLEPSLGLPLGPVLNQEGPHRPQDAVVRGIPSVKISPAWGPPHQLLPSCRALSPYPILTGPRPPDYKAMTGPFLSPSLASTVEPHPKMGGVQVECIWGFPESSLPAVQGTPAPPHPGPPQSPGTGHYILWPEGRCSLR